MRKSRKITRLPDMKHGQVGGNPNLETIWTAIDRLRDKGVEIYETDVLRNKNNFMFNVDKPWIQTSIHKEIQVMIQEERDKKIQKILD
jgi:hypothetical protein